MPFFNAGFLRGAVLTENGYMNCEVSLPYLGTDDGKKDSHGFVIHIIYFTLS